MTPDTRRVLGIDLGDARIGLALSDPLRMTAQPLETLTATGLRRALDRICDVARYHDVGTIVLGLPLLLSGEDGERAVEARRTAERLRQRLPGVTVELWDERLTTREARRTMGAGGSRRRRRSGKVDMVAAVLILQAWLDARGETA